MCYIEQQTNQHLRELDARERTDAQKTEISEFYFNQLADNQEFTTQFVNALFTGDDLGDKVALNAQHLIQSLIKDIANSESETDIVNKFRNGIETFCDEAAKQLVDSGKDIFELIDDDETRLF
ncbi:hypothetical protein [Candidatus Albibeggiatoa sp. nov. BB20]|uniref:hypothetical protein n=1 Tax=Candidatus Albibeggiatoa sp. nov. BB20 TaxID=3162723 RepID=UPI003365813B